MKSVKFLAFNRRVLNAALASVVVLGSACVVSNAYAATGTANTTATVITPISIAKNTDLAFGKFSALTGGSIKVDTDNAISVTGAVVKGTGSTGTAAKFTVSGDTNNSFSISHSTSNLLTHTVTPASTMALATVSALTAASGTTAHVTSGTLSSGTQTIFVGGTLTVASGQLAGDYAGTITTTVEYN